LTPSALGDSAAEIAELAAVLGLQARYPQYRGHLYWETLPPELLVQQIKAGGGLASAI